MPQLISKSTLKTSGAIKAMPNFLVGPIMRFSGLHELNSLYASLYQHKDKAFVNAFFAKLNIQLKVPATDLQKIPAKGACVVVANHPFGAVDGLAALELVLAIRPDVKVMANFLLHKIEPIKEYFIPVNPFEQVQSVKSISGMKQAMQHLQSGGLLVVFPAGEVSAFQPQLKKIADSKWQIPAIKLIQKTQAPVVPMFFKGHNSLSFQVLGLINPLFRTARLPKELFKKANKTISVAIGKTLFSKELQAFTDVEELSRYLRAKTYALEYSLNVKPFFKAKFEFPLFQKPLASEIPSQELTAEVQLLKQNNQLILQQGQFEVYWAAHHQIPKLVLQIAVLREYTFRKVGEGTNKPLDTDEFDIYYKHLFVWDAVNHKIAGAYRIGLGNEILNLYGPKGFYTRSLFKFSEAFHPILQQTAELGRSFVTPEYQQKPLPLFLLWRGILAYLKTQPTLRYILGPVSISNQYSKVSKSLMVEYIKTNHYNEELAQLIKPKKEFKPTLRKIDSESLLNASKNDMKLFDKIIADIEPNHFTIPILLKKYLKQNAQIIGFNVDPKFSQALDGLMILDLNQLPDETIQNLGRN